MVWFSLTYLICQIRWVFVVFDQGMILYLSLLLVIHLGRFSLKKKDFGATFGKRIHCSAQHPPPAWPGRAVVEPDRKTWDGPKPISIVGSTGSIGTQVKDFSAYLVKQNSFPILSNRMFEHFQWKESLITLIWSSIEWSFLDPVSFLFFLSISRLLMSEKK